MSRMGFRSASFVSVLLGMLLAGSGGVPAQHIALSPLRPGIKGAPLRGTAAAVSKREATVSGVDVLASLPHRLTDRLRIERVPGAQPRYSRRALLRAHNWVDDNVRGTAPGSILLRRVTDTQYGPVDATGRVVDPVIEHRLVWVIADSDAIVCAASGGPYVTDPPPNQAAVPRCGHGAFITLIDAGTGEFLASYQS